MHLDQLKQETSIIIIEGIQIAQMLLMNSLKLKLKLIIPNYKIGQNSGTNKHKQNIGTIIFQVILFSVVYCLLLSVASCVMFIYISLYIIMSY